MPERKGISNEPRVKKKPKNVTEAEIFEAAFERGLSPVAVLDLKFNFIRVNPAFASLCNKSVHEYTGRNYFEFFPSAEHVKLFSDVLNSKLPHQAWSKPTPLICLQGVTRTWDWSLMPILGKSGEVRFLVLTLYDVTEREKVRLE